MAKNRSKLAVQGFSAAQLDRMRAPIDLPIGGETPGEIEVSIAAEIVQIKNQVKVSELPLDMLSALEATNEPAILATIIEKTGSSQRGIGSRMLVTRERLASATPGRTSPNKGKVDLKAGCDGLLKVNAGLLNVLNDSEEIMYATLHANQLVTRGQKVGGTQVIPPAGRFWLRMTKTGLSRRFGR